MPKFVAIFGFHNSQNTCADYEDKGGDNKVLSVKSYNIGTDIVTSLLLLGISSILE